MFQRLTLSVGNDFHMLLTKLTILSAQVILQPVIFFPEHGCRLRSHAYACIGTYVRQVWEH